MQVEVVATKPSLTFFDIKAVENAGSRVWIDDDEWLVRRFSSQVWNQTQLFATQPDYKIGDPILHIELRRWADIVLVAPCSANTLSKIAGGICDNLAVSSTLFRSKTSSNLFQTSLLRALAPTTPTYIFPAMNTLMYEHPLTAEHLRVVSEVVKYNVEGPIGKALACGDVGTLMTKSLFWIALICILEPTGTGAMTEWKTIVQIVVDRFQLKRIMFR